jgi:sulfur-oxidizing protein SoxY
MSSAAQRRRQGLLGLLLMGLPWSWRPVQAQKMNSGQLLTFEAMVQPWVKGARLLEQDVTLIAPLLAENGSLVPLQVQVNSPMTAQDHVTQVHLLSQRNPVTQMAVFELGPWNGRADISTRVRLAGTQEVVALASLSSGEFRYARMEIIVTESACVDAS